MPISVLDKAKRKKYDACVIGAGPNGLAAAITLSQRGLSVLLIEGADTIGGACRSAELTEPGFIHDTCSSVYPLGVGSPFFRTLPLADFGLKWIHPPAPYGHPFDENTSVIVERSIEETANNLGQDGHAYYRLMKSLSVDWDELSEVLLRPLSIARFPLELAAFGVKAIRSCQDLAVGTFPGFLGRGTFAGICAHSSSELTALTTSAVGLVLGYAAHGVGWPFPEGGAQKLSDALSLYFQSLGGELVTNVFVGSLNQLPDCKLILCDMAPSAVLRVFGRLLSPGYRMQLGHYKHGPGTFKMDWSLDGPIPWSDSRLLRVGTVHIGATLEEMVASERAVNHGHTAAKPYVLLAQHTLFDPSRAPSGKHTVWAYSHVPNGSTEDISKKIEAQIERFAPGFTRLIRKRHIMTPYDLQKRNPNLIGGDINGGALNLTQLFTRPAVRVVPYSTSSRGLYICSSSTPPGSGVHGMSGYYAALAALSRG